MNAVSIAAKPVPYHPKNKVRFVTATSLFDGHDASVNIMRRILQASGAEVIHLGHNRSVQEIVNAAVQEDVQGVAVTSYQGGHVEFFKYMVDLLREQGRREHQSVRRRRRRDRARRDPRNPGLRCDASLFPARRSDDGLAGDDRRSHPRERLRSGRARTGRVARRSRRCAPATGGSSRRIITAVENRAYPMRVRQSLLQAASGIKTPVLGITGTGGAGKSSLTDELILRLRLDQEDRVRVAVLSIDPSRKRTGGALLGDRIRMNAIDSDADFHAFARHARHRHGAVRGAARSARRLQAERLRSRSWSRPPA